MKNLRTLSGIVPLHRLMLALALLPAAGPSLAGSGYTIRELGALPGGAPSEARAINNGGIAVGSACERAVEWVPAP